MVEDMQEVFEGVPFLYRIRIIRKDEVSLGREFGSVWVEFRDARSAMKLIDNMKDRVYDGR